MLAREGQEFGAKSLAAWVGRNCKEVDWLRGLGERFKARGHVPHKDLWRLYAMSRVVQLMTLAIQTGSADGSSWHGPGVTRDDLCSFAHDLGLEVFIPDRFSSFDGEVVRAVVALDPDEAPAIRETHWPCLMLGELLVGRAGASI